MVNASSPHRRTTPKIFAYSQELRHNTTPAKQKLWNALRACQLENVHFKRQHAIGNYIVDFCAARQKLIIELDGGQHLEQEAYDQERTEFLQSKGYRVLRFWNHDIDNNLNGVVQVILDALSAPCWSGRRDKRRPSRHAQFRPGFHRIQVWFRSWPAPLRNIF